MAIISPDKIEKLIKQEAGIRLLMSKSVSVVLAFLYDTFRKDNIQEIPFSEFKIKLESFLLEHVSEEQVIQEDIEDRTDNSQIDSMDLVSRVKNYCDYWLSDNKRFISRYYNQNKEEMIKPDPSVVRLFSYIDSIVESDYISTESSFNFILTQLRTLSENIEKDPEERIRELKSRIRELEGEINEIEATGKVKTYDSRRINEYLNEIRKKSRDMLGEFSQVEENFKYIMTDMTARQMSSSNSKHSVIMNSLSLYNELSSSPQGQSFNGFWEYLTKGKEDEISRLTERIQNSIEDESSKEDSAFLFNLRPTLFSAGKRIIEKNHLLTERMSKVMAQSERKDRKGIDELYSKIKAKAACIIKDNIATDSFSMEVETRADLLFPLAKTLYTQDEKRIPQTISFKTESDTNSIIDLKNEFFINEEELLERVYKYSRVFKTNTFSLMELYNQFPVEKGLEEIIALISLFKEKKIKYDISNSEREEILYQWGDARYKIFLPKVTVYL